MLPNLQSVDSDLILIFPETPVKIPGHKLTTHRSKERIRRDEDVGGGG